MSTRPLAALLVALLSLPAAAQSFSFGSLTPPPAPPVASDGYGPDGGDFEITLGGSGSSNQDLDAGSFGAAGSFGFFLTSSFEIAVRQSYNFSDFGDSTWNASTRGAIDFHIDLDVLQPFFGANLGYIYGDDVHETLAAAPEAGLKIFVKDDVFIFAMAEYQFFFDSTSDARNGFEDGQFVYSLGLGFTF